MNTGNGGMLMSEANKELPEQFFVDAGFLVNLVQSSDPQHRQDRHRDARRRWTEFVARKTRNPRMRGYWSPGTVQNFLARCALALLRLYQSRNDVGAWPESHQQLLAELEKHMRRHDFSREDLALTSAPSPLFLAAALPVIMSRLQVSRHLTMVSDRCHKTESVEGERALDELFHLVGWGALSVAGCITVLTAQSAGAAAILTDDKELLAVEAELRGLGIGIRT